MRPLPLYLCTLPHPFLFSRSIGTEPNEVNFSNAGEIFDRLYGKYYSDLNAKIINPHFALDQKVRLVLPKNTFKKGNYDLPRAPPSPVPLLLGYKQTFSRAVFTIAKVYKTFPPRYSVKDEEGDIIDSQRFFLFEPFFF